jgi:hypothetical protein
MHKRWIVLSMLAALGVWFPVTAAAQIKAPVRPAPTPAWNKGIQPISAENYYNAIECGKQGGDNPACVFWDTDLCKNDDFDLAGYTGYKQVAYEVWTAVRRKQPAPQPSYGAAQLHLRLPGVCPHHHGHARARRQGTQFVVCDSPSGPATAAATCLARRRHPLHLRPREVCPAGDYCRDRRSERPHFEALHRGQPHQSP